MGIKITVTEEGALPAFKICPACANRFDRPRNRGDEKWRVQVACGQRCYQALRRADPRRFWNKVQKTDSCWLWTGNKNQNGYGLFTVNWARVRAHRYSYEIAFGAMSDGTEVCHKCDNPPCVNPDHLFLGTHAENMKDMGDKGRRIGKAQGEESGRARLAAEQIVEIRRRYAEGGISYRDLAARYGVGKNTIQAIIQRRSWRHVDA